MQDHNTSGLECSESSREDTANIGCSALRETGQNEDSADDDREVGAYSTENCGQARRRVVLDEHARHTEGMAEHVPTVMKTVRIDRSKMVVDKSVQLSTKRELRHAKAELVRLTAHVTLLNKLDDRLECEFIELKVTVSTFDMKDRDATRDNVHYFFCSSQNRQTVMHSVGEVHSILNEEGVQLMFHSCFTNFYERMFISQNIQLLKPRGYPSFGSAWTQPSTWKTKDKRGNKLVGLHCQY